MARIESNFRLRSMLHADLWEKGIHIPMDEFGEIYYMVDQSDGEEYALVFCESSRSAGIKVFNSEGVIVFEHRIDDSKPFPKNWEAWSIPYRCKYLLQIW